MTAELLDFWFTKPNDNGQYDARDVGLEGGYYGDWFRDDGYERALRKRDADEAMSILAATYKGPDVDGIGLEWHPL